MAPILNKVPYKMASYFPKNTKYLLGFNEPNLQCATHCSVWLGGLPDQRCGGLKCSLPRSAPAWLQPRPACPTTDVADAGVGPGRSTNFLWAQEWLCG